MHPTRHPPSRPSSKPCGLRSRLFGLSLLGLLGLWGNPAGPLHAAEGCPTPSTHSSHILSATTDPEGALLFSLQAGDREHPHRIRAWRWQPGQRPSQLWERHLDTAPDSAAPASPRAPTHLQDTPALLAGLPTGPLPPTQDAADFEHFLRALSSRPLMLYFSAPDGLYGLEAASGQQRLYHPAPDRADGGIARFTSLNAADVRLNGRWHSVLLAGLGEGEQGAGAYHALDITQPGTLAGHSTEHPSALLWRYPDEHQPTHRTRPGASLTPAAIVKLNSGQWAVLFGDGARLSATPAGQHTTGAAQHATVPTLFVVSLDDGALIAELHARNPHLQASGSAHDDGLSGIAPVDVDQDGVVDLVYGGALDGSVWKFDLSASNPARWHLAYRLFQACTQPGCPAASHQSVIHRPVVLPHPDGLGLLVLFATHPRPTDDTGARPHTPRHHSLYAVLDRGRNVSRDALQAQYILDAPADDGTHADAAPGLRLTTRTQPDWRNQHGWYLDLPAGHAGHPPEHVAGWLELHDDRLAFTTRTAPGDCNSPALHWRMQLDAVTGTAPTHPAFDSNQDGHIDARDQVSRVVDGVPVPQPPSGIAHPEPGAFSSLVQLHDGTLVRFREAQAQPVADPEALDPHQQGRIGWLRVR